VTSRLRRGGLRVGQLLAIGYARTGQEQVPEIVPERDGRRWDKNKPRATCGTKITNKSAAFWDETVRFGTAAIEIKIRCLTD
jgi:hypothetical protein